MLGHVYRPRHRFVRLQPLQTCLAWSTQIHKQQYTARERDYEEMKVTRVARSAGSRPHWSRHYHHSPDQNPKGYVAWKLQKLQPTTHCGAKGQSKFGE